MDVLLVLVIVVMLVVVVGDACVCKCFASLFGVWVGATSGGGRRRRGI